MLTALQAQSDFDLLRAALEEAHDGLYRFANKAEVDRRFTEYRKRLVGNVTQRSFTALISEVLAVTRDGHMRLEYDEATTAALREARLFPFRVTTRGSQLFVLFNDSPGDTPIRPGMEILSVNGHPSSELLSLMMPNIPGDGFIETGKRARLATGFARYYWLFVDSAAEFAVVARDRSGKTVTAKMAGITETERSRRIAPAQENVSLLFLKEPDVAHLRIRAFNGDDFPQKIADAIRVVREKKIKAVILDLRGNGGGVDEFGALLVSQFVAQPFRYFDRIHLTTIHPSFATWKPSTFEDLRNGTVADPAGGYRVTATLHSGVAVQQPVREPFSGKLIVLTDGGTFSTAADVSAILHALKRATFVGEETGGGYEGNTSGLNALIKLPYSGLSLKIPMYGYWNAVPATERGRGVQPDAVVTNSIEDLIRGIDAQLQSATAIASRPIRAGSNSLPSPRSHPLATSVTSRVCAALSCSTRF